MVYKFNQKVLQSLSTKALLIIIKKWRIETTATAKHSLIKLIFNHRKNWVHQQAMVKHTLCNGKDFSQCLLHDCPIHPQARSKTTKYSAQKLHPTKFCRNPLPICWFVAGCQFLATFDWPESFSNFAKNHHVHLFSQFFKLIQIAKMDVTASTFKSAPMAYKFIENFKTNLEGDEIDWNLTQEQDATEFIITFLDNINKPSKETIKSFFKQQSARQYRCLINFIENKLSITEGTEISCQSCNHKYLAGGQQQCNVTLLTFPQNQNNLVNLSVQKLINMKQKKEKIKKDQNHKCENCLKTGTTSKEFLFKAAPKYLILNLARFEKNILGETVKINSQVHINSRIKIKLLNEQTHQTKQASYEVVSTLDHHGYQAGR